MTKRATILASLLLCVFALNAGQRAAQTFDGVKMAAPLAIALPTINQLAIGEDLIVQPPPPYTPAPLRLSSPIPGNPLFVAVETSADLREWRELCRWWNDYIRANYALELEVYPTQPSQFYRWRICYRP